MSGAFIGNNTAIPEQLPNVRHFDLTVFDKENNR